MTPNLLLLLITTLKHEQHLIRIPMNARPVNRHGPPGIYIIQLTKWTGTYSLLQLPNNKSGNMKLTCLVWLIFCSWMDPLQIGGKPPGHA